MKDNIEDYLLSQLDDEEDFDFLAETEEPVSYAQPPRESQSPLVENTRYSPPRGEEPRPKSNEPRRYSTQTPTASASPRIENSHGAPEGEGGVQSSNSGAPLFNFDVGNPPQRKRRTRGAPTTSPQSSRRPSKTQSVTASPQTLPVASNSHESAHQTALQGPKEKEGSKKKKLFGKKDKNLDSREKDNRIDLRRRSRLFGIGLVSAVLLIVGLAIYRVVAPSASLTEEEVANIAYQVSGETGFPLERGEGFAKDFIQAYLTVGDRADAQKALMSYYTTGTTSNPTGGHPNISTMGAVQEVVVGPTIYDSLAATPQSANYVVGALVRNSSRDEIERAGVTEDAGNIKYKTEWRFFSVNVYYNEGSDTFAIVQDSPTVVPPPAIHPTTEIPVPSPLGAGKRDQNLESQINSLVVGFLKGYAVSNVNDYSDLEQYIIPNPPASLTNGLNGAYALSEESVSYEAYPREDGKVTVRVSVVWRDDTSGDREVRSSIDYKSQYIMTLEPQGEGRYLVGKFQQEFYVPEG